MSRLTIEEQEINDLLKDFVYKPGFLVRVVPHSQLDLTIEFNIPIWTCNESHLRYGGFYRIDWRVIKGRMASGKTRKEIVFEALRGAILDTEIDIARKFLAGESPGFEPSEWVLDSLRQEA